MALELRSPNHPQYTGTRKPKGSAVDDADCWELYRLKHPEADVEEVVGVVENEDKLTDIPEFLERKPEEAK